ncbi:jg26702 [Pararge aegeria aegeria]|uniref:Jg26702 protein n=1 Tax=Pararge aegeria aegeria TaxID=348720 RepID=A0A8S4QE31_9NEOP|nr:jg26702 [Pararge aegeria aegeria]
MFSVILLLCLLPSNVIMGLPSHWESPVTGSCISCGRTDAGELLVDAGRLDRVGLAQAQHARPSLARHDSRSGRLPRVAPPRPAHTDECNICRDIVFFVGLEKQRGGLRVYGHTSPTQPLPAQKD